MGIALIIVLLCVAGAAYLLLTGKAKVVKTSSTSSAVQAVYEARDKIVEAHFEKQFSAMGEALAAPLTSFTVSGPAAVSANVAATAPTPPAKPAA